MLSDLQNQLKEVEEQEKSLQISIKIAKKELLSLEDKIIFCKISKEKLAEKIRIYKNSIPSKEKSDYDKDIERFSAILPELLKKIKEPHE